MMKKTIITLIIFFIWSITITAQSIGIYSNYGLAKILEKDAPDKFILVPSIGLEYQFNNTKQINYVIGIEYNHKGTNLIELLKTEYITTFGQIKVGNDLRNIELGLYGAFLLDAKIYPNPHPNILNYEYDVFRPFDIGLMLDVHQYLFTIKNKVIFDLQGSVSYGITNTIKHAYLFSLRYSERNFSLGLGLNIHFQLERNGALEF